MRNEKKNRESIFDKKSMACHFTTDVHTMYNLKILEGHTGDANFLCHELGK